MSVCIPRFADAHISQNVSYRGDVQVVFETGTFDQGPIDVEDYGGLVCCFHTFCNDAASA